MFDAPVVRENLEKEQITVKKSLKDRSLKKALSDIINSTQLDVDPSAITYFEATSDQISLHEERDARSYRSVQHHLDAGITIRFFDDNDENVLSIIIPTSFDKDAQVATTGEFGDWINIFDNQFEGFREMNADGLLDDFKARMKISTNSQVVDQPFSYASHVTSLLEETTKLLI